MLSVLKLKMFNGLNFENVSGRNKFFFYIISNKLWPKFNLKVIVDYVQSKNLV